MSATALHVRYALEDLYRDQEPDYVIDAVPAVLAWLGSSNSAAVDFAVRARMAGSRTNSTLSLTWNLSALKSVDPTVEERHRRMASGRSAQREHVTELAAYGLALVTISTLLPGRKVVAYNRGYAPDLLLDATPGALRGVEVAGRTTGGWGALNIVRKGASPKPRKRRDGKRVPRDPQNPGKASVLKKRRDCVEVYLSLWCSSPTAHEFFQVKP